MSYLGNAPARSFISFERQVFSIVNSQTAYALSHSVTNENDIRLVVNNVVQEPGSGKAYTATGTALTLSAALTNGTDEMYCVFLGRATATSAPGAGSIGTAQLASDSVTLAKMASGTDGNIISYDASGNPVAVATGNDGQVLTSAGAGAPPVFENAGGGAWNLLQTVTASSSATVQLTGMDSTYKNYAVIYTSMIPATDDTNLNLRIITAGGVQSGASDYLYAGFIYRSNGSTTESVSAGAAQIAAGGGNFGSGTGESGRGTIYISDPSNTSVYTVINGMFAQVDNGGVMGRSETAGAYKAVTAVTGVEFLFGSGAVASGVFKLYGIS